MFETAKQILKDAAGIKSDSKPAPAPAPALAVNRLREKHVAAVSDVQKRGPGRPPNSDKRDVPKPSAPTPSLMLVDEARKNFRDKVGCVFEGFGLLAAMRTDCTVWLLTPEQKTLLGDSYGDLLITLGFSDALALQILMCLGSTVTVFGIKTIQYRAFDLERKSAAKPPTKIPDGVGQSASAKPERVAVTPNNLPRDNNPLPKDALRGAVPPDFEYPDVPTTKPGAA